MTKINYSTDVVIIGAGPVGLFTIFECGMLGLKCHVVDALEDIGGQCTALYPEKPIYDIPGFPSVSAAGLIENLEKQAEPFHPTYHLSQTVNVVDEINGGYIVRTSKDVEVTCKVIIIAAGAGAFGPNRPPLQGIEEYEGQSVFYACRSREQFRDKRVVIAGGGDSAVDWALSLSEVAKSVAVVHRRDKFRAAPESVSQMRALAEAGSIDLVVPFQLHDIRGEGGVITEIDVSDLDGGVRVLETDILLPFFGLAASLGPIEEWGLGVDHHHIHIDQSTSMTNRHGIFAVGDVATYDQKLKLILTGFAEAAQAAHSAYKIIHPDQALHVEYSTTKGIPA